MAKRDALRRIDSISTISKATGVAFVTAPGGGGGSGMVVHGLNSEWHTGSLMDFPEYVSHINARNAHHYAAVGGDGITVTYDQVASVRLDDAANHPGLEFTDSKLHVGVGAGLYADGANIGLGRPASISATTTNAVAAGGRNSYNDNGHVHAVVAYSDGITIPGQLMKTDAEGDASIRELTTNKVLGPNDLHLQAGNMITFPQTQVIRTVGFNPAFPIGGFQFNPVDGAPGKSALTVGSIQADELYVRFFVANETRVDRGDFYIAKSYGYTSEDFVTPVIGSYTRVYFADSPALSGARIFADGDWVMFSIYDDTPPGLTVSYAWGQISHYLDEDANDKENQQSFRFTMKYGVEGFTIPKGSFTVGWGASGQAIIKMSAVDQAGNPYIKLTRWQTYVDPLTGLSHGPYAPAAHTDLVHIGRLSASSIAHQGQYGIVLSNGGAQSVEVSEAGVYLTNARIVSSDGTNRTVEILPSGSMKLGKNVQSALDTGFAFDATTGNVTIGKPAGNKVLWDAANNKLTVSAVIEILPDSSGFGDFIDANMDNIDDGSEYGRIKTTIIKNGMIQVSTGAYNVKDTTLRGWNIGVDEIVGQYDGADQVVLNTLGQVAAGQGSVLLSRTGMDLATYQLSSESPNNQLAMQKAVSWWDNVANRSGAPIASVYTTRSTVGTGGFSTFVIDIEPGNTNPNGQSSIVVIGRGNNTNVPTQMWFTNIDRFIGIPGIAPERNPQTSATTVQFSGSLQFQASLLRSGAGTIDIGATGSPFDNLYVNNIVASTITGSVQMGGQVWQYDTADMYVRSSSTSNRTLYLANPGTGVMHLDVEGNIAVGGTVDGVDVATFKGLYDTHTANVNAHHAQAHGLDSADHTGTLGWAKVSKAGSDLADLATRNYSDLQNRGHAYDSADHTGALSWAKVNKAGSSLADLATRNYSDLQNRTHGVLSADHSVAGSAWQIVGLTAANTLGLLSSSSAPGVAEAILRTDATGSVAVQTITLGTTSATAAANLLFAGHAVLRAQRAAYLLLDSNNDETGVAFVIAHNSSDPAAATELFRFTDAGRMGVGVPAPSYSIDAVGSIRAATSLLAPLVTTTAGDLTLSSTTGNVGIGTATVFSTAGSAATAPGVLFNNDGFIAAKGSFYVALDSDNNATGSAFLIGHNAPTTTGFVELFRFTDAGRLGVGVPAPAYELDVAGSARVSSTVYAATANVTGIVYAGVKVQTPLIDTASGNLTLDPLGGVVIVDTTLRARTVDSPSGQHLTVSPALDLQLQPGSNLVKLQSGVALQSHNYASQTTGMRVTNAGEGDFRYLFTDEMHAKSFIADLEQALAGGQIISKSVAELAQDFTVPAAGGTGTIYVRDLPSAPNMAVFESGDIIRLRQFSRAGGGLSITNAWGAVTGYTDQSDGTQSWTFTRSTGSNAGAMTTGAVLAKDLIILDYGVSGNGFYEVNAIDGLRAANSPYLQFVRWTGHPATGSVTRLRAGQLKGLFSQDEFGLFAGTGTANTDRYLRLSDYAADNGINNLPFRLRNNGEDSIVFGAWNNVWIGPSSTDKRLEFDGTALRLNSSLLIGSGIGFATDALLYCAFDGGDPRYSLSGDANGHLGQPATLVNRPGFRPGKFGSALEAARSTQNLIGNSTFEADAVGAAPSGWALYVGGSAVGSRTVSAATSYDGRQSVRVVKTVTAGVPIGDGVGITRAITVTAGQPYTVSAWVYLGSLVNAPVGASLAVVYASGGGASTAFAATGERNGWTELKIKVTPSSTTLTVYVWLQNCDGGEMYVDAVQVLNSAGHRPYWPAENGVRLPSYVTYGALSGFDWRRFSMATWFKLSDVPSVFTVDQRLCGIGSGNNIAYIAVNKNNDRLFCYLSAQGEEDASPVGFSLSPTPVLAADEWHHAALVVDYPTLTLYLDGAPTTLTLTRPCSGVPGAVFAGSFADNASPLCGWMDDFIIAPRPFTANEVAQIALGDAPIRALASAAEIMLSNVDTAGVRNEVYGHAGGLFGRTTTLAGVESASFALINMTTTTWGGFGNVSVPLQPGDLVIGHNKAGSAAIFYDQSAGSFGFYGNANSTPQVEILNTGTLKAINADLSGKVTATSGAIANWTIAANTLSSDSLRLLSGTGARLEVGTFTTASTAGMASGALVSDVALWAGSTYANRATAPFAVSLDGHLYADDADITGVVTASSGAIGGWTITSDRLYNSTNLIRLVSGAVDVARIEVGASGDNFAGLISRNSASGIAFWAGKAYGDSATAPFRVTLAGALTATSATITGVIQANTGYIGGASGWAIAAGQLTSTNVGLYSGLSGTARLQAGSGATSAGVLSGSAAGDVVFWGGAAYNNLSAAPFRVTLAGKVYARDTEFGSLGETLVDNTGIFVNAQSAFSLNYGYKFKLSGSVGAGLTSFIPSGRVDMLLWSNASTGTTVSPLIAGVDSAITIRTVASTVSTAKTSLINLHAVHSSSAADTQLTLSNNGTNRYIYMYAGTVYINNGAANHEVYHAGNLSTALTGYATDSELTTVNNAVLQRAPLTAPVFNAGIVRIINHSSISSSTGTDMTCIDLGLWRNRGDRTGAGTPPAEHARIVYWREMPGTTWKGRLGVIWPDGVYQAIAHQP